MKKLFIVLCGGLFLVAIPLIPTLLRLRLRFLQWIGPERAAKNLEKHFQRETWLLRILFFLIGICFLYTHGSVS